MSQGGRVRTFGRKRPIDVVIAPFQQFAQQEASGGILLVIATVVALIWANSPWVELYEQIWHTPISFTFGSLHLEESLVHWINDGLMVIFFFVVGLEIKREVLVGELASPKKAALPVVAAAGGMVVPALFYYVLNAGTPAAHGWGVPMATDIAFAIGVLALLGNRVPTALKVFLVALAIADDIGAVLVIAFFYTTDISMAALGVAAVFLALLVLNNLLGVRKPIAYGLLGIGLWLAFLESGVHATIAGILLAMTIPARTLIDSREFMQESRQIMNQFEAAGSPGAVGNVVTNEGQQAALRALETAVEDAETPLQRLEHMLHPWTTFLILPLFALANAGVSLSTGELATAYESAVTLGVMMGLTLGKPLGITIFSALAVWAGLAAKPAGANWKQIHGVGWLAGIGFTMALFIANLAFADAAHLAFAKVGILTASLIAGIIGTLIVLAAGRPTRKSP